METEQTLKDHLEGVEQRAKARLFLSQEIPTRNPDCTSDYSKHYNHDYKQGVVHAAVLSAQTSSVPTAHATAFPLRVHSSSRRRRRWSRRATSR